MYNTIYNNSMYQALMIKQSHLKWLNSYSDTAFAVKFL